MNVTDCTDIAEDLSLHAAGEPAPHVEAHLAACSACRVRHAELSVLCDALSALREIEPAARFGFRRALWPLAIAASVLVAMWPSAPTPPAPARIAPTWFALQRAALGDDAVLDRVLAEQTSAFTATLHAAAQASPFDLAQLEP